MQSTLGNYLALSLLLLICLEAAADGIFYGSKCITDTNIEEREGNAEVVLSGKIKAIHRTNHNTNSTTYHCSIHIYRVMKGDTIVSSLLGLPAESRNHYTRTIEVAGFGNAHICDSDVTHGDVRIFLLSYTRESNLTLNSSLVRIGIRSLKLKLTSNPGQLILYILLFGLFCKLDQLYRLILGCSLTLHHPQLHPLHPCAIFPSILPTLS